jgi:peroxiredoxin family protein
MTEKSPLMGQSPNYGRNSNIFHITNGLNSLHRKWHTGNQYMVKSAENRMHSNLEGCRVFRTGVKMYSETFRTYFSTHRFVINSLIKMLYVVETLELLPIMNVTKWLKIAVCSNSLNIYHGTDNIIKQSFISSSSCPGTKRLTIHFYPGTKRSDLDTKRPGTKWPGYETSCNFPDYCTSDFLQI